MSLIFDEFSLFNNSIHCQKNFRNSILLYFIIKFRNSVILYFSMNFHDLLIAYFSRSMHLRILVLPICFSDYESFFVQKTNCMILARLIENDNTRTNLQIINSF